MVLVPFLNHACHGAAKGRCGVQTNSMYIIVACMNPWLGVSCFHVTATKSINLSVPSNIGAFSFSPALSYRHCSLGRCYLQFFHECDWSRWSLLPMDHLESPQLPGRKHHIWECGRAWGRSIPLIEQRDHGTSVWANVAVRSTVHSLDGIADIYSLARIVQEAEKSLLTILNVVSIPGSEPQSTDQLLRQLTPYVLSRPLRFSQLNWL